MNACDQNGPDRLYRILLESSYLSWNNSETSSASSQSVLFHSTVTPPQKTDVINNMTNYTDGIWMTVSQGHQEKDKETSC